MCVCVMSVNVCACVCVVDKHFSTFRLLKYLKYYVFIYSTLLLKIVLVKRMTFYFNCFIPNLASFDEVFSLVDKQENMLQI